MDLDDDELKATREMNGATKKETVEDRIQQKIKELEELKNKVSPHDIDTMYKDAYYAGGIDALSQVLGG